MRTGQWRAPDGLLDADTRTYGIPSRNQVTSHNLAGLTNRSDLAVRSLDRKRCDPIFCTPEGERIRRARPHYPPQANAPINRTFIAPRRIIICHEGELCLDHV